MTKTEVTREELSFKLDYGKISKITIEPYGLGWEWEIIVEGRLFARGWNPALSYVIDSVVEITKPWQETP